MTDTTIWIVSFEPAAHCDSGVGGWDWNLDREEIEMRFDAYADEDSNVFLFQWTTDLDLTTEEGREALIAENDSVFSDPGSVEGFALRKHIPAPAADYNVTITATVTKTIRVSARSENEAYEKAHELFSVMPDGMEKYDEQTDSIVKVEEN